MKLDHYRVPFCYVMPFSSITSHVNRLWLHFIAMTEPFEVFGFNFSASGLKPVVSVLKKATCCADHVTRCLRVQPLTTVSAGIARDCRWHHEWNYFLVRIRTRFSQNGVKASTCDKNSVCDQCAVPDKYGPWLVPREPVARPAGVPGDGTSQLCGVQLILMIRSR